MFEKVIECLLGCTCRDTVYVKKAGVHNSKYGRMLDISFTYFSIVLCFIPLVIKT